MIEYRQKNIWIFVLLAYILLPCMSLAIDTLWTKTYGGASDDNGYHVAIVNDGCCLLTGTTHSYSSSYDIYVLKTDSDGDTLWTQRIGGDGMDIGFWGISLNSGKSIVVGTRIDTSILLGDLTYIACLDTTGSVEWVKTYGQWLEAHSATRTFDGGYAITGGLYGLDAFILKTDSIGDSLWVKTYGGASFDDGSMIIETSDSCLVVVGFTDSYGAGFFDVYLFKTDTAGNILWWKTYGGTEGDWGYGVHETHDGGFIVCGYTGSFSTGSDIYLIKTDSLGDSLWTRTYDIYEYSQAYSVIETHDNEFALTGVTSMTAGGDRDLFVLKIDEQGDTICHLTVGGNENDYGRCIAQTVDSCYVVIGYTTSYGAGGVDIYFIKTTADLRIKENMGTNIETKYYPYNTIIKGPLILPKDSYCKIFDITGRQIHTLNPAPGIYFIEVDGEMRQKVIKIK